MAQLWRSSESTRLPPMWPRFDSRTRHQYVDWVCCWFSSLLREVLSGYSSFPLSSKANIPKFQFDLDYCQALYHEPIAREIAQALPVLLAFKKLLFFHICDVICRRSEYRMTSFCTSTFRTSDPTQVYSLSLARGMLNTMVVYHLSPKSGNFGWNVNGKTNLVCPIGKFPVKTGFLER